MSVALVVFPRFEAVVTPLAPPVVLLFLRPFPLVLSPRDTSTSVGSELDADFDGAVTAATFPVAVPCFPADSAFADGFLDLLPVPSALSGGLLLPGPFIVALRCSWASRWRSSGATTPWGCRRGALVRDARPRRLEVNERVPKQIVESLQAVIILAVAVAAAFALRTRARARAAEPAEPAEPAAGQKRESS